MRTAGAGARQGWPALLPLLLLLMLRITATQKVVTAEEEAVQVQAVAGGGADLPCDISTHQHNDSVLLVVWYRDDSPIYSWDARGNRAEEDELVEEGEEVARSLPEDGDGEGAHWSGAWGARARWSPQSARLALRPASAADRGEYRCRADFRASPTRNTRVYLQVIEAVGTPVIRDDAGREVGTRCGPYREGDTPTLICTSQGGYPAATVRWYRGGRLLEAGRVEEGSAALKLGPLAREDLLAALSCHASNSPLLPPTTALTHLDMQLAPLNVEVGLVEAEALSAGRSQQVECRARGARPAPQLSLHLQGQQLQTDLQLQVTEEERSDSAGESGEAGEAGEAGRGGTVTLRARLTASSAQHGQRLVCRASHPLLAAPLEAQLILNVLFPPSVNLSLGAKLNPHDIEEGDDVYFECSVLAHPPPYKLLWEHNGKPLVADAKAGVTVQGGNLVLRGVSRAAAGAYSCSASNVEGDARSLPVHLQVMFKPVCSSELRRSYGVGRQERVQLICEVEAVPPPDSFSWALNNSAQLLPVAAERFTWSAEPARSTLSFTPLSDLDYGTALCWASNLVGKQAEPCALTLLPAARPHAPANCSLANLTSAALEVACEEGWDGGLPQRFQLEVWERATREERLLVNMSSGRPSFLVGGLRAGRALRLLLYAHNSRGRSPSLSLDAYTLELAEKRTDESSGALDVGWMAGVCGGTLAALLLLALLALLALRVRSRSQRAHSNYTVNKYKNARSELQQQLHDDKNPDVVPLNKGNEYKVTMEGSLALETAAVSAGAGPGVDSSSALPRPPPYSRAPPTLLSAGPVPMCTGRAGREVVTTRAPLPAAQESDV